MVGQRGFAGNGGGGKRDVKNSHRQARFPRMGQRGFAANGPRVALNDMESKVPAVLQTNRGVAV